MLSKRLDASLTGSAPIFAALGDPTRLRLVSRLSAGEALSITALAAGAPVTRQAITKHLQVLEDAGLIDGVRHGRERLHAARRAIESIERQWDAALGRLEKFVEEESPRVP